VGCVCVWRRERLADGRARASGARRGGRTLRDAGATRACVYSQRARKHAPACFAARADAAARRSGGAAEGRAKEAVLKALARQSEIVAREEARAHTARRMRSRRQLRLLRVLAACSADAHAPARPRARREGEGRGERGETRGGGACGARRARGSRRPSQRARGACASLPPALPHAPLHRHALRAVARAVAHCTNALRLPRPHTPADDASQEEERKSRLRAAAAPPPPRCTITELDESGAAAPPEAPAADDTAAADAAAAAETAAADAAQEAEDAGKQKPNAGNGGEAEWGVWAQTLTDLELRVPVPPGTTAKALAVDTRKHTITLGLKGAPPILQGACGDGDALCAAMRCARCALLCFATQC
jgi:hypothetical protein